ncbi:Amino-acid transporter arg-13 [Cyphellophora attinorum]|uniref:Amino-acid transporter arg-13 n=1 Tax=Cyphellophora attinorum TaxID=1664694 RepID=A0A0N1NWL7_9EURO|nr:Amino-acid transporter arg-13 [Phialophora attinorum]KPI36196.1 Amino-acid transporter arg-13 [Phialophora attinorum]
MAAVQKDGSRAHSLSELEPIRPAKEVQAQGVEAFKDVVFGSTAGVLGKFVEYPFDTVKVRLQSQHVLDGHARLHGPIDAFVTAFRSPEGPLVSLYRGITAPLLGAAVETSCLFFSYRVAQDALVAWNPSLRRQKEQSASKELPFSYLVACGAISGAFTSLALTPIELVKCKMQVPASNTTPRRPPSIPRIIMSVFRTHGLLGFWHGQLGTLIRETGGSAAWFGSYEGVKKLYVRYDQSLNNDIEKVKLWQQLTAGAVAGMLYNFTFYPADTIKSRMQTEEVVLSRSQGTFLGTGRELWKQSGLRGFYRGCGITVFRAAPSSAIIFSVMEALRKRFG